MHRIRSTFQLLHTRTQSGLLLRRELLVLLPAQFLQLVEQRIRPLPGLLHNLGRLLPGTFHLFLGLSLSFFLEAFRLLSTLPGFFLRCTQSLEFILHLAAILFQTAHHLLKCVALLAHQLPRPIHDFLAHAQTLGNGKGIGFTRYADQQPVSGTQGGHIKFAAAILHPRSLDGIGFQLRIVGRAGQTNIAVAQLLDDGLCQGSALHRVGTSAQLVQKNQAAVVRNLKNLDDIHHVGRKGGQ